MLEKSASDEHAMFSGRVVFALDPHRGDWLMAGFSDEEAIEWQRVGFVAADANQWRGLSFRTAAEAAPWYRLEVPLTVAKTLKAHDMTPEDAALWFPNSHITPSTRLSHQQIHRIMTWINASVPFDDWVHDCVMNEIAYEDWIDTCRGEDEQKRISVEEVASAVAYQWNVAGFSESVKRSFRNEGITNAFEARQWFNAFHRVGLQVHPRKIFSWHTQGFSPEEAVDWLRSLRLAFPGIHGESNISSASKWKSAGFSPFEMYMFSALAYHPWSPPDRNSPDTRAILLSARQRGVEDVFRRMYDNGIPEPQIWDVEELRVAKDDIDTGLHLTIDEIHEWVTHGFAAPDAVFFWKDQGFSAAEANERCKQIR